MITLVQVAMILFFAMFFMSGLALPTKFSETVSVLQKKTGLPYTISYIAILGGMILKIAGPIIMVLYFFHNYIPRFVARAVNILFLIFMIIVTIIYHPPWKKIIPFMSNLTIFAGLLIIYTLL